MILKYILIIVFTLIGGLSYSEGSESIDFELTKDMISQASISLTHEGKYSVIINLKEQYKTYLADLTDKNISKRLNISICGQTLIRSTIMGKIESGLIEIGGWDFQEEAGLFSNELLATDIENNCERIWSILEARSQADAGPEKYVKESLACLSEFEMHKDLHSLDKGLEIIDKAIEADRGYALAYYWKAFMLSKKKDIESAIITLNQGIKYISANSNEEVANLYLFRGILNQIKGSKEESWSDYRKSIKIYEDRLKSNPKNWDSLTNISHALALVGKKEKAVGLINEKIEEFPEEPFLKHFLNDFEQFNVTKYLETII